MFEHSSAHSVEYIHKAYGGNQIVAVGNDSLRCMVDSVRWNTMIVAVDT